jgi:gluconate 2-dehydrogenase gamma chain
MAQGVAFFNPDAQPYGDRFLYLGDGRKDIGYMGNVPNQWNGVPADVLQQYGLAYSEKELKECVTQLRQSN